MSTAIGGSRSDIIRVRERDPLNVRDQRPSTSTPRLHPVLRAADLPTDTRILWRGNRTIRYELS